MLREEEQVGACIVIHNVSKKYRGVKKKSLENISCIIPAGIYGLIGENGAGKTTLLKTLATVLPLEEGEITICGYDLKNEVACIRKLIGYIPQEFGFFDYFTVYEMMNYIAVLKGIEDEIERRKSCNTLIEKMNLMTQKDVKIKNLSGGMRQRLGIAQALLGDPKVIILDEPTVGLDPNERLRFRNIINAISKEVIIILSTHIMSDIAMMCGQVGIMQSGKMIYSGDVETLLGKMKGKIYIDLVSYETNINEADYGKIISVTRRGKQVEVRFIKDTFNNNNDYIAVEPTLEDAYFYTSFCEGGSDQC